ncbi:molybdenum cofactor cytidylyltransferase [Deinococcus metalli]|uniref:Molybdenum cofactor cytidylyltransferase n=1 Tax=Deinococcus metalli TaxID=1141878 RepID=A0A7W8NR88_9DEIO|nr:nucleotidyltransferase family protein [Deinococcus metalli]MBB5377660.1 molybdenum cofactor cytidylyltransferase [Deinococcus metalli]
MTTAAFPVAGVLLAAGLSTRMGRPKQLAPLRGRPLCTYAADALAGAGHTHLLAVIPPGDVGDGIRAALAGLDFAFAVNPEPARGLASSFRTAVRALPPGLAGANFALGDMPLVTADVHRALLAAFHDSGAPVVLAEYGDGPDAVRAPPHVFRTDLLRAVQDLPDADHGPRAVIGAHRAQAVTLRFPAALLLDVDTPAALDGAAGEMRDLRPES